MNDTEAPRATSGSRFHRFGESAYAVILDARGREVSDRHDGDVWIAIAPGDANFLFADQHGGNQSRFVTTDGVSNPRVGIYVDDDLVHVVPIGGYVSKGAWVEVDWTPMYDAMS